MIKCRLNGCYIITDAYCFILNLNEMNTSCNTSATESDPYYELMRGRTRTNTFIGVYLPSDDSLCITR